MLTDTTGVSLGVDNVLHSLPVSSYVLPGIFLSTVMGVLPLILAFALLAGPNWKWATRMFGWSTHYWAWTGTLVLSGIIVLWLAIEGLLIGFWPITYITAILALLIFFLCVSPSMRKYYANG